MPAPQARDRRAPPLISRFLSERAFSAFSSANWISTVSGAWSRGAHQLAMLLGLLFLIAVGAAKWSLDARVGHRRCYRR